MRPPGEQGSYSEVRGDAHQPLAFHSAVRELHHDLRQPVATINALVAAAEKEPGVPESVLAYLERIAEQSDHILALCRHILEAPETPRATPLRHLAAEVAEACNTETGCPIEVVGDSVVALVDEVELRRAVQNLLENAARAAGPAGRVVVDVRDDAGTVHISVADSGPGFGAIPSGEGLGLSVVKRFALHHGGRVEVRASELGGATVTMTLRPSVLGLSRSGPDGGRPDQVVPRKAAPWQ